MLNKVLRNVRMIVCVLIDQGAYSLANFAFSVLLATWLSKEEYGKLAVVIGLGLTVLTFHSAFLLEPSGIIGPKSHGGELRAYTRAVIRIHLAACLGFLLLASAIVGVMPDIFDKSIAWMFVLSTPFLLSIWLMRRLPYVEGNPVPAARASVVYAVAMMAGLWGLRAFGSVTLFGCILVMSVSGLLPFAWRLVSDRRHRGAHARVVPFRLVERIAGQHWRYSRTLLMAALLSVPTYNVLTVVTASLLSVGDVGVLRAVMNLVTPVTLLITACTTVALPLIARTMVAESMGVAVQKTRFLTAMLTIGTGIYYAAVVGLAPEIDRLIYHGRYHDDLWLVPILGLQPLMGAISFGRMLLLRANDRQHFVLVAAILTGPASLAACFVLIPTYGLAGAAWSSLVSPIITVGVIFLFRLSPMHGVKDLSVMPETTN